MTIDTNRLRRDISQVIRSAIQSMRTGQIITDSLYATTRSHIQARQPGSTHWALNKITKGLSTPDQGEVNVDVAGASRAYRDITILPRWRQNLTIPLHPMAKGKKAEDIDGLFRPRNKNVLCKVIDGQLTAIFALVKRAFQRQDSTLLPTDETFATNIGNRWVRAFFNQLDNLQSNGNVV